MDHNISSQIVTMTAPPFLSSVVNCLLLGVITVQLYFYFQAFPNDRRLLKVLVYSNYLLNAAQTALMIYTAWNMFVIGFGDIPGLSLLGPSWISICLIEGCVALIVQSFYAHQIGVLSQNRIIPSFIVLMALISFGGATGSAARLERVPMLSKRLGSSPLLAIWLAVGSICDITIVACMCYYLWRGTKNSTFKKIHAFVDKFTRLMVETGALTAYVSTLSLVLYYYFSPGYFEVPLSALAKIYSATMLAVLNSRMKIGIFSDSATWLDNELEPQAIAFHVTRRSDTSSLSPTQRLV